MRKAMLLAGVCAIAAGVPTTAWAQGEPSESEGPVIDDGEVAPGAPANNGGAIIVTANRREQDVQDVGASVAVLSADTLATLGVVDSEDIGQLVPGVYVSGAYGGQSQQYTIRGVTQSDYLDTIENPVAFYIDDVYVVSAQGQTGALYDIERVEVLKGPQGTLFGRNATGGLVHNVIAKPRLGEVEGYVQASYGRFNEANIQGAVNVPLGSIAAVRASGLYSRIDDYWDNLYPAGGPGSASILSFDGPGGNSVGLVLSPNGQDLGGSESVAGRLQLLLEPSADFSIRLTGSYSKTDLSTSPYTQEATIATIDAQGRVVGQDRVSPTETRLAIGPGGANYTGPVVLVPVVNGVLQRPALGGNFFGYVPLDAEDLELSEDFALSDHGETEAKVFAGHLEYDLGPATLYSVTSYQEFDKATYLGDGSPVNVLGFAADSHTEAWSQELRLNGETDNFRWQVGAFYLNTDVDLLQGILEPRGSALANLGTVFTGNPLLVELGGDLVTDIVFGSESISVFGQGEYDFGAGWTIIAGGRYIHENQTYSYRHFTAANLDDYAVEGDIVVRPAFQPNFDDDRDFDLWTGKLQLEYRPNTDWLLYAGINRGVKAGNYNAPFTFSPADVVPTANLSYEPEKLLSYEGGFKFSNGPFLFNASAFYYDYKDFQAFVFTTASGVVRNVDSEVYGLDLEAAIEVTEGLRIGGNFAYQHAEIADFEIAPGVFRDVRPPYAPRTQATGTIDYETPGEVFGGTLGFNATVSYAGAIYHNIRNFNAHRFDARTLLNLSATWRSMDEGFFVTVYGRNVFDERYGQVGFDNTVIFGAQNVSYGNPATYGVTLGFDF